MTDPRTVECPFCGAPQGLPCSDTRVRLATSPPRGLAVEPHDSRVAKAQEVGDLDQAIRDAHDEIHEARSELRKVEEEIVLLQNAHDVAMRLARRQRASAEARLVSARQKLDEAAEEARRQG